jgi:hypothetical protein
MNHSQAQMVIETLRKGIPPPPGYTCQFTVGRKNEINELTARLSKKKAGALLLKANYGSGKTHLLKFIRETALREGYAVSTVTLDAKSAVRFNRMDQIFGAIFRGLEIPAAPDKKGIRPFFDFVCNQIEVGRSDESAHPFWKDLSGNWRWSFSNALDSPSMFVALRAWATGDSSAQDLVEDWLFQPWVYQSQRKRLYLNLVEDLRRYFRDPRDDWQFYSDGVFSFNSQGYDQSWAGLRDLISLASAAGLKGVIILFDEFEDVLNNIKNINHQQAAFWNLFQFYDGKKFPGMTFFAVTPEFVHKCKKLLLDKGYWDYDYSQFESIPTFEMSPLEVAELETLSLKIMEAHGLAYDWEPDSVMKHSELKKIVKGAATIQVEDRVRYTVREVVKTLDHLLEGE